MKPNRLIREASPYLLQHAKNPVDWYPWGAEALEAAKRLDRPILLSIGYSACHWCHVMERECFENEAIAKVMNEWFVNIKVDREERPDLDQVYQLAVQLLRRSGGWPLTVFLTPDQRPFFAGTYFPPEDRYGMPGFPKVLQAIWEAYHGRREEVAEQAAEMANAIASVAAGKADIDYALGKDVVARAASRVSRAFDMENGGFHNRPKFPNTMALEVLLRAGDEKRVRRALDAMRAGGIWDQLGGGFHRYSTDEKWLVPHFEKMLYDNALLLRLYVDGWRAFGEARYAETARAIAAYVAREMTDAGGGFYATQDADSEGQEGKFFVWDEAEIRAALAGDEEAARAAIECFGVTAEGNFEDHGEPTGKTVLFDAKPLEPERAVLDRARAKLFAARESRPKPFRDEKILASWNGLMISALADAGAALGDDAMIDAARRAFAFVEAKLVKSGRVLRHTKGDIVKGPGFLDDHAYVARAALDLYEATGEPSYVSWAREIADQIVARFADQAEPGFFFTPDDGEALIHRAKDPFDQAVPSGQSVACEVLLRLGALVEPSYAERARVALEALAASAVESPMGFGQTLCVLDRLVRGSTDVVVVGPRADARTRALAAAAAKAWVPNRMVAWLDPSDPASRAACAALAEGKEAKPEPVAYVCREQTCSLPLTTPAEVAAEASRSA
jgi:uncharacterized protein YyaL (SSP411 family)